MKVKREKVENSIKNYLKEHFNDNNKTDKIKEFMTNKGYTLGEITKMINLNQYPEMWNETDLGIMMLAIHNIEGLDINDYYNQSEIEKFNNFYTISKKSVDDAMIFESAFPIGYFSETEEPTQFMVAQVPIQQIREAFANKKIGYDPDMQRNLIRLQDKKGEITEKINVDKAKKIEIAEKTLSHEMFANAIVLNVMKTGQEEVKYNWDTHKLIIENNENTNTFIIDGYNRSTGYISALERDPDVTFYISVIVCIFNKEKAGQVIADIDKQTPISKAKAKMLSTSNPVMDIAKRINRFGSSQTNEMYNKLAEDYTELKIKKDKYCTFETFAESVKYNFFEDSSNKISPRKIDNTTEFLAKGFNEILGILIDKFDNIENIRQNGYYLENNTFIGYVALLSKVQNNENWKQVLEQTINSIDFSSKNNDWRVLEVNSNKVNKSIIKKISSYFIERGGI